MTQRHRTMGVWLLLVVVAVTAIGSCGVHLPSWYYACVGAGLTVYLAWRRHRREWRMDGLGNALLFSGVLAVALLASIPNMPRAWARASLLDRMSAATILIATVVVLVWAYLDSRLLLRQRRAQSSPSR